MARRQSRNAGKDKPVILNQTISQSVNAWDSTAFSKLLSEQAKANETAIKSLESSMVSAGANQQQLAEQIAQSAMMKDIKEALIAQLQDKKFNEAKVEAIKLKDQEKLKIKEANDALKENLQLRKEEAKAIANIAKGMETFQTMGDRLRDMGKKLKDNFGSMSALKVTALKAFNVGGIFNKSIAKEKFIQTQRKLGSEDNRETLAGKFESANKTAKEIKRNESELSQLKKDTGMSEADIAKTTEGKRLLSKRDDLSNEYAKSDLKAGLVKRESPVLKESIIKAESPTQAHADSGISEERALEAEKHAQKQEDLFIKIEQNTRGASPDQKVKPAEDKGGDSGGGGNFGKALQGMKNFGIGLIAIAGALYIASKAFENFGKIEWESIGKGMVALGGLVVAALALDKVKGNIIAGSAALGILALATYGIGAALGTFAELDWETIGKGMAAIAGLGVIGAIAGTAAPLIFVGALALGAMGGALYIIGEAMQAVGQGFAEMSDGLEKIGKLDGSNLLLVGAGLASIGVGMAALGVGTAVAGVSNLVTGFLSAVTGQKTPVEQLLMLGEKGDLINQAGTGVVNIARGLGMFSQIDTEKVKAIAALPIEKIAAMGLALRPANAVEGGSRANADASATAGGGSGNKTNVVNAPVTNNSNTTQIIKSPIRNQESSQSRYLSAVYGT
jgi:hypothetical protein